MTGGHYFMGVTLQRYFGRTIGQTGCKPIVLCGKTDMEVNSHSLYNTVPNKCYSASMKFPRVLFTCTHVRTFQHATEMLDGSSIHLFMRTVKSICNVQNFNT